MEQTIPQGKITEIIEKLDIYEVISQYITLKKSGRNYKANCPFHEEKTPSFLVSPEKQIFHCFGCGVGGNAINFLMKMENISFAEAVYQSAKIVGVHISPTFGFTSKDNERKNSILESNKIAFQFFSENLLYKNNKTVLDYLSSRGFSEINFKRFSLGYAPYGNRFVSYLKEKSFTLEKFISAGLILKASFKDNNTSEKIVDCFRDRLIIPIFDLKDNIIGFGGRTLDENIQSKYLNTAENEVFKKGQILYGLNWAKESIKKYGFVIIVEGYFDLLKLHLNGLDNVVAPLGTALTDFHLKILKRWTEKILLVFDSDQAGSSATLRSLESILRNRFDAKIAPLPLGLDPDSFVDNYGINSFKNFINEAKDFVEYKISLGSQIYDIKSAKGKAMLALEILKLTELIPNAIEQKIHIKKISEILNIEEEDLFDSIKKVKINNFKEEKYPIKKISSYRLAEKMLVELILQEPEFYYNIINRKEILKDILSDDIKNFLESYFQNKESDDVKFPTILLKFQEEKAINFISQFAFISEQIDKEKKQKVFDECLCVISKSAYLRKIEELKKIIRQKEEKQEPIDLELEEIQSLYYRLRSGGF